MPSFTRFEVEPVAVATKPPPILSQASIDKAVAAISGKFYSKKDSLWDGGYELKPKLEVSSLQKTDTQGVWDLGSSGLFKCCFTAFANHHPLLLAPDHIWGTLLYGFARHVEENAEALRSNFVQHKGKKVLVVDVDHFRLGGTPAETWEKDLFPNFSKQIQEHIGESSHSAISGGFSTTTATDQASHEIVLMAAMKKYFAYKMRTRCGIPWVGLEGSVDDWQGVRDRAEKLGALMVPAFAEQWMAVLLPVLDQFVLAAQGKPAREFWRVMCKKVQHGKGSGAYTTVSGWIGVLYPYLKDGSNPHMVPWEKCDSVKGPEPDEFPACISSTPVVWEYFGQRLELHFHAGMLGASVDIDTGALRPLSAWLVTHDPPADPAKKLLALQAELKRLELALSSRDDWETRNEAKEVKSEIAKLEKEL